MLTIAERSNRGHNMYRYDTFTKNQVAEDLLFVHAQDNMIATLEGMGYTSVSYSELSDCGCHYKFLGTKNEIVYTLEVKPNDNYSIDVYAGEVFSETINLLD